MDIQKDKERNQIVQNALNKILQNPGYLKCGKGRLAKLTNLSGKELEILHNEVKKINRENYQKTHVLSGYWLKTKYISAYFKERTGIDSEYILDYVKIKLKDLEIKFEDTNSELSEKTDNEKYVGILNVYDIHLDKIPLFENPNVDEYLDSLYNGIDYLLNLGEKLFDVNTIIFPVGGDLFNTNGFSLTTKKGTPQSSYDHPTRVFKLGLDFCLNVINKLISKRKNVYIPVIYGNHDRDVDFYLGAILESVYHNNDCVKVNNTFVLRKYYNIDKLLFGFGHGDIEKRKVNQLPLVMASEVPTLWSNSTVRTFYLGDIHHKEEYKFLKVKDFPGCTVSFLRSVSKMDQWHNENMYIGIHRTLEYHIYNSNKGNLSNLTYNL